MRHEPVEVGAPRRRAAPRSRRARAPCRPRRARARDGAERWRPVASGMGASLLRCAAYEGRGAGGRDRGGKFLRGLVRVVPGDDLTRRREHRRRLSTIHGLRVSPDLDSVTYWLGDVFDRERGWGRRDETFRATEELRALGADAGVVQPRRPRSRDAPVPDASCSPTGATLSRGHRRGSPPASASTRGSLPDDRRPRRPRGSTPWMPRRAADSTSTSRSTGCSGARPTT